MALKSKPFSDLNPVFSLRAVVYEFFQKKFKHTWSFQKSRFVSKT